LSEIAHQKFSSRSTDQRAEQFSGADAIEGSAAISSAFVRKTTAAFDSTTRCISRSHAGLTRSGQVALMPNLGVMVTRMFGALTRRKHFRKVLPSEVAVLGRHR
jgi:hypothetical protein